jgi:hypothetical protein
MTAPGEKVEPIWEILKYSPLLSYYEAVSLGTLDM